MKELEEENEELLEKVHELKKEKGRAESDIMLMGDSRGNGSEGNFEIKKLRQKCDEMQNKVYKKKEKIKKLNSENNIFHQTTTIFLTIKKIVEKEKKFCF